MLKYSKITVCIRSTWPIQLRYYNPPVIDALKSIEPDPRLGNPGRIIDYVVNRGFNYWTVQSIPIGFAVPILSSIYECRMSPPLSGKVFIKFIFDRRIYTSDVYVVVMLFKILLENYQYWKLPKLKVAKV